MFAQQLISGGLVVAGTPRAKPTRADILVAGDRIVEIAARIQAEGARRISAEGCIVAPGFIDAHAHSDENALLDPRPEGRISDGVATEINGCCGSSLFPLAGPVAAHTKAALRQKGIGARWSDAAGYFDALAARGSAINRGFLVGHGAIRAAALGDAGRPPRPRELRRMQSLTAESLEQGALGISSGLVYAPGCFARTSELIALCRAAAPFGRPYATHMRSEGRRLITSVREALRITGRGGVPLHISHVKTMGRKNWGKIETLERLIFSARKEGRDVTADRYPYTAAMTGLSSLFPTWLKEGGLAESLKRLKSPSVLDRLRGYVRRVHGPEGPWERIRIAMTPPDLSVLAGMTIAQAAEQMGCEPFDATVGLLRRCRMQISAIFFEMSQDNLDRILQWPFVCIGSDSSARSLSGPTAGGMPHPRAFGTMSRFLSEYALRRKLLPLPQAVWRMTGLPAERFGLKDRGVLRPGAYADIVVLDPARLRDRATYDEPWALSEGVKWLLVNGTPVLENGRRTRALPGRVLRA